MGSSGSSPINTQNSNSSLGYGPSSPPYNAPGINAWPPTQSYYGAYSPYQSMWSSILGQMGIPTQGLFAQGMSAPQTGPAGMQMTPGPGGMTAAQSSALSPTANQPALDAAIKAGQTGGPGQFPTMAAYKGMAPIQDPNTDASGHSLYWGGANNPALWGGGFPGMNYSGYTGPKSGTGPGMPNGMMGQSGSWGMY